MNYSKTDQQIHWLSQILAKANRTYVPKKEDDSHTNLYFDSIGDRIMGRWINGKIGQLMFTLNLKNQHVEILDSRQKVLASFPTQSRTRLEVESEIEDQLPGLGLDPAGFVAPLHFDITEYSFANDPIQKIDTTSLEEWMDYRELANEACLWFLGFTQTESEIRIWPHHFDTGIYTMISENLGLGFGWAMEDDVAGAPYYYLAGYPNKGSLTFENVPKLQAGRWETEGEWKGAVLTLSDLEGKSHAQQRETVAAFVKEGLGWYLRQS